MGANGIYGLSGSGLDIESMVTVGMMGKQKEYDKMAQKFTKNEWTKTALLDVYSNINTFNMSTLSQYKLSVNMNARTAISSNDAIKVTANASAAKMSHKVEVTQLATSAHLISTNKVADEAGSSKLSDILGNSNGLSFYLSDAVDDNGNPTNDKYIEVTAEEIADGFTLTQLASRINQAGLNIKATYDVDNDVFSIYNNKSGKDNVIDITGLDQNAQDLFNALGFKKSVDGELKGFNADDDESDSLGFATDANGDVLFDDNGEPIRIATSSTNSTGNALHFDAFGIDNEGYAGEIIRGTNAKIKIDGVEYESSENKISAGGVTYDITNATAGETVAKVTVAQDVDGIVDRVKSFIEDYNKLLSSIYDLYDEKSESGYNPLTQSQKDAMKEEQITKWEEKAKKGLLYHDKTLSNIISQMRNALSTKVDGIDSKYNSIFSIGISTTGYKGQLVLDETKLRRALDEDPDSVYNVFGKLDKDDKASGNGVAQRLGDIFTGSLKNIKKRSGSSADITEDSELNNLLRTLQTKMSNFKKMMDAFEERLYKKYDTMEATLAKLGSQLNYITGGAS
jgi:flagellar hook-associated protein 2